jgi:hypothetical protein
MRNWREYRKAFLDCKEKKTVQGFFSQSRDVMFPFVLKWTVSQDGG